MLSKSDHTLCSRSESSSRSKGAQIARPIARHVELVLGPAVFSLPPPFPFPSPFPNNRTTRPLERIQEIERASEGPFRVGIVHGEE